LKRRPEETQLLLAPGAARFLIWFVVVVSAMAAPGGLEQWQKDGFFQAAEEVQESADL
jgi:hypothetical protein